MDWNIVQLSKANVALFCSNIKIFESFNCGRTFIDAFYI